MARIVITTWGSAGDLNPYLALGRGLMARGHDVLFAVDELFRAPLEAVGFATHVLTGDAEAAFLPHGREMFASATPIASIRTIFTAYVLPTLRTRIEELRAACEGADLLVSNGPQVAASFVADLTGIRWASMVLTPLSVPSE